MIYIENGTLEITLYWMITQGGCSWIFSVGHIIIPIILLLVQDGFYWSFLCSICLHLKSNSMQPTLHTIQSNNMSSTPFHFNSCNYNHIRIIKKRMMVMIRV